PLPHRSDCPGSQLLSCVTQPGSCEPGRPMRNVCAPPTSSTVWRGPAVCAAARVLLTRTHWFLPEEALDDEQTHHGSRCPCNAAAFRLQRAGQVRSSSQREPLQE